MEEATAGDRLDVVLFPWLAFGHMIPYLELAKRLAARGHTVTFLSTPRNITRLPPVPPHLSPRVRLVALPPATVEGLHEGAESTADVPPEKNELIKKAVDGLAAPFAAFLAGAAAGGRRPDWVVVDFCHNWAPAIAGEHGVPCATFQIVPASFIAFFGSRSANAAHPRTSPEDFTVLPEWCAPSFPPGITYRRHEAEWWFATSKPNASGVSDMDRMWEMMESTRFAIYRSDDEVEPAGAGVFALLSDLFHKPAIPAGILLQPELDSHHDDEPARPEVLQWLDKQPSKSVIYVALGSEAPLTATNLHELALGLELAGGLIARTMAERRVGVEVARDDGDGSFGRDDVAAAVRRVMVEEEGKVFATNAERMKRVLGDQRRQDQYMEELEGYLIRYKDTNTPTVRNGISTR
nr:unnamed protein product [Digitaria exilis]